MSTWRSFFSYNKYTQIASRAVRTGLKESERVGAEKRANIGVKYQQWENGKGGEQKFIVPPTEPITPGKPPV
ncbi:mitochondrial ATP synthase epsilon chain-domain-containing protein [Filobasidium floriforme]|uniref:mitochondrial ATP synthase epsilon chain-domain-containing protein n=1 Tax=Filobasidium floriforme TaxID=5210 RepID=UPI001E8DB93D|nr:mitochondrial ATP synthase epsilon chain-domain-containing protein [Filobasidium floriforme]KAH8080909.1 mitochondrial ATP synthase epsilon chain-domain-containing protein [Filobasidium floriforme]